MTAYFTYKPDFMPFPIAPVNSETFNRIVDENNINNQAIVTFTGGRVRNDFSRSLGSVEKECIAYQVRKTKRYLIVAMGLLFFNAMDRYTAIALVVAMATISLVFVASLNPPLNEWRRHFRRYLGVLVGALFNMATWHGLTKRSGQIKFGLLFTLWLTALWLLQQHYGGDMFGLMSLASRPDLIDSWTDLADKPNLRIAAVADFVKISVFENKRERFFNPESPFYDDFTARLHLVDAFEFEESGRILEVEDPRDPGDPEGSRVSIQVDTTTLDGDTVLMHNCDSLRYKVFNAFCGTSRDRVHVSESGGEFVPYFIVKTVFANEDDYREMNKV